MAIDLQKIVTTATGGQSGPMSSANPALNTPTPIPQPQKMSTPVVPATDMGTTAINVPKIDNKGFSFQEKLKQIETSALALKDQLASKKEEEIRMAEINTKKEPRPLDVLKEQMMTTFSEGQGTNQDILDKQNRENEAAKLLNDLNTDMISYAKDTRDEIMRMRQNPEGKTLGALEAEISNFEYNRYNRKDGLADLAIAASYAQGNYQKAASEAQNAVDAEARNYERKMDFFQQMHSMLQNDMTESESQQFQSNLRLYENQVNQFNEAKSTAIERASQQNAPAEVLTAIKNATSIEDIWSNAGQYGEDPTLTLAKDKFAWDRQYAMMSLSLQQQLKAGTLAQEEYTKAQGALAVERDLNKMSDATSRLFGNQAGFDAVTGTVKGRLSGVFGSQSTGGFAGGTVAGSIGGPIGAGIGGILGFGAGALFGMKEAGQQAADFAADMNYLYKANIPEAIRKAKEAGWTGTMTNTDIENIAGGAEALFSLWNPEEGNFGNASPERVKEALTQFRTSIEENKENLFKDPTVKKALLGTGGDEIDNLFQ